VAEHPRSLHKGSEDLILDSLAALNQLLTDADAAMTPGASPPGSRPSVPPPPASARRCARCPVVDRSTSRSRCPVGSTRWTTTWRSWTLLANSIRLPGRVRGG